MQMGWRWGIPILAGGVAALAVTHALSPGTTSPPDLFPAGSYPQHAAASSSGNPASSATVAVPMADPKVEERPSPGSDGMTHQAPDPVPSDGETARLARARADGYARELVALLRMAVRRKSETDCLTLQAKLKKLDPSVQPVVKAEFDRERDPILRGLLDAVLAVYGKK